MNKTDHPNATELLLSLFKNTYYGKSNGSEATVDVYRREGVISLM